FEEIAVGGSRRRTGAAIARAAEVGSPLARAPQVKRFDLGDVLRQVGDGRRKIVQHPVDPRPGGGVRVIGDEGEGASPRWCTAPSERGGQVGSVARVLYRDRGPVLEGRAGEC